MANLVSNYYIIILNIAYIISSITDLRRPGKNNGSALGPDDSIQT